MKFDLVAVLESYGVRVPHRSGYAMVCCPVHQERRASMSVRGHYARCFGCGWGGDAIDLIQEMDGVGYADAVRKAEEITGQSRDRLPAELGDGSWFPVRSKDQPGTSATVASWRSRLP